MHFAWDCSIDLNCATTSLHRTANDSLAHATAKNLIDSEFVLPVAVPIILLI